MPWIFDGWMDGEPDTSRSVVLEDLSREWVATYRPQALDGVRFTVLEADERKVSRVKVTVQRG